MTKILVVSDSHGDDQIVEDIVAKFGNKVDTMFHTGDSEFYQKNPLVQQFHIVIGNMDYGVDFPVAQVVELPEAKVFETHGHKYNVNFGLTTIMLAGEEQAADIILFGHTHQLLATMEQGMLLVNPGSISQPRGQYAYIGGTFAIIDIAKDSYEVQFYNRELRPIKELDFVFKR